MAPKLVKAMQEQISTLLEKTTSRSDNKKNDGEDLIQRKLSRSVSHDSTIMKEVVTNPRNSNFCTMDESHQKTWIVLTEDEKAELEMVLFEMTLYDLGLR